MAMEVEAPKHGLDRLARILPPLLSLDSDLQMARVFADRCHGRCHHRSHARSSGTSVEPRRHLFFFFSSCLAGEKVKENERENFF